MACVAVEDGRRRARVQRAAHELTEAVKAMRRRPLSAVWADGKVSIETEPITDELPWEEYLKALGFKPPGLDLYVPGPMDEDD